ncbi:MAG: Crp/Fnr family transcriptional regulator [Bacteroidota bacterium]
MMEPQRMSDAASHEDSLHGLMTSDWTAYRQVTLKKNQMIGPDSQYPVLLLVAGSLLISHQSTDHERSYATVLRGPAILRMDLVGDMTAFKISALLSPCKAIEISASQLPGLMTSNSAQFEDLVQLTFAQYRRLDVRADEILTKMDAELRLLSFLAYEGRQHGVSMGDNCYLNLPLSHRQIADVIFACRQSVSSTLSRLRKLDLIAYDRKSIIIHSERFNAYLNIKRLEHHAASSSDSPTAPNQQKHPIELLPTGTLPKSVGHGAVV